MKNDPTKGDPILAQMHPQQAQDVRNMAVGLALIRIVKAVAGLLARKACIAQGIDPDKADEYDRGKVRIDYGEPVPEEAIDKHTGATIMRCANVIVDDKYLYAEVQLVHQPPRETMHVRALVGNEDFANELDPQHTMPVEWIVRKGEYDSGRRLF